MNKKTYDLNINKIVSTQWEISDALRELIANANDESILSKTKKPIFNFNQNEVMIRDFGRGIEPKHFINNENKEKRENKNIIGHFGVGLKDSINVLYNKGLDLKIETKNKLYKIKKDIKPNTNEYTLFVEEENSNNYINGTLVSIKNIKEEDWLKTLKFFLNNENEELIYKNKFGEIYKRKKDIGRIYFKGVLIGENEDIYYTYNILEPLKDLTKNLNRERKQLSKTAFMSSILRIIINLEKNNFKKFIEPYKNNRYIDFSDFKSKKVLELYEKYFEGLIVSQNYFDKLEEAEKNQLIEEGYLITNTSGFIPEFKNEIINEKPLILLDKKIIKIVKDCLNTLENINIKTINIKNISIADKIVQRNRFADGCANIEEKKIILNKSILYNKLNLIGVLAHELNHINTWAGDETRQFEEGLDNNFKKAIKNNKYFK